MRHNGLGSLTAGRTLTFRAAAVAAQYVSGGEGIMLGDTRLFGGQIACGRLASRFAAELDTGCACYLVTHRRGQPDAAIALFRDRLLARLAGAPACAP